MSLLSSIGIGNASVDTILPESRVRAGESIEATVEVEGGDDEQDVEHIYFAMLTEYHTGGGTEQVAIDEFDLTDGFTIGEDEERTFEVTIDVPPHAPVTRDETDVWIETGLDIDWAVDPDDKDEVAVEPDRRLEAVLDALADLGFDPTGTRAVDADGTPFEGEFVQRFDHRPIADPYADEFDDVALVTDPEADELPVALLVDINEDQAEEVADHEYRTTFEVTEDDADAIVDELDGTLRDFF
jgi:sporulation-control protein